MSFESAGYQLLPVLPELVLAVGAMVLLDAGGLSRAADHEPRDGLAVCLLVLTGVLELGLPVGNRPSAAASSSTISHDS